MVDEVSEELNFNDNDIEDTSTFGTKLEINDILGMAKSGGGVKILLYIDRVLRVHEKINLQFWELSRPVGKARRLKEYQAYFDFRNTASRDESASKM
ncbi:MAG: hypothetical protein JRE10_07030 [Deltaproteobacteria bacterium]|nr:hypothetical protein [Deltaproteobacteria bacterium]MBW2680454.1 hypothetical protein [Deltaproteobacteria bacterium]